jgi:site-specific DNA-methyltransferase (adenine-specific)
MKMQIIEKRIEELIDYENNPRHNEAAVGKVAASIEAFGFKVPIVIDKDNVIIAGHTRRKAAERLGLQTVPCIVADDLTEEQVKAFRLADNKTSEFAEWDFEKLNEELAELRDMEFDMSAFGFEDLQIEEPKEITEDEVPEVDEESEPITKLGDIWQLGRHRLMCGSSTDEKDVRMLMNGEKAKMLFTSPPYSDMREYNGGKDLSVEHISSFIARYKPFTDYQCVNLGIQRKDHEIVQYWDEYIDVARQCGYKLMAWNIWDKTKCGSIGNQSAFFPIRHEWIFVFGTEFYEINCTVEKAKESIKIGKHTRKVRQADGTMSESSTGDLSNKYKQMESVVQILPEQGSIIKEHPATFPVQLPAEYIQAMTDENDVVIESFGGSGTTLIACEQLNRICHAMELDPKYCDVIVKRWENLTGEKAVKIC